MGRQERCKEQLEAEASEEEELMEKHNCWCKDTIGISRDLRKT